MGDVKRRPGRPTTRSDRWYALVALVYCTAFTAVVSGDDDRAVRQLTTEYTHLAESSVTSALAEAQRRGLFSRDLFGRTVRGRTGGRLTPAGWTALGELPASWQWSDEDSGEPAWRIVPPPGAHLALKVLRGELLVEWRR